MIKDLEFLTIEKVASMLRVNKNTISRLILRKKIKAVKLGEKGRKRVPVRVIKSSLMRYLETCTT